MFLVRMTHLFIQSVTFGNMKRFRVRDLNQIALYRLLDIMTFDLEYHGKTKVVNAHTTTTTYFCYKSSSKDRVANLR